jgi:F-type H+-transporting ATPase subunit b
MQINLTPDPSLLAIMVIFFLNYLIVRKFFLQPINGVLEAREQETMTADKLYEESLARFNEATSEMEIQLHNAKREAAAVRERYRGDAAQYRQAVVQKTSAEAKQIVTDAETRLAAEEQEARETILRDADALAREAAARILGRAI